MPAGSATVIGFRKKRTKTPRRVYRLRPRMRGGRLRIGIRAQGVHNFERMFLVTTIVGGGAGATGAYGYAPTFNLLPNFGEFQALFDRYRINSFTFIFEPQFTGNDTNGVVNAGPVNAMNPLLCGYWRVVVDKDDIVVAGYTENTFLEYQNVFSFPSFGKTRKISFVPRIKLSDENGLGDIIMKPRWLDMDNVNIPHYGIKIWSPVTNTLLNYTEMKVYCKVNFSCADLK